MARAKLDDVSFRELQRLYMLLEQYELKVRYFASMFHSVDMAMKGLIVRHNSQQESQIDPEEIHFIDYLTGAYYTEEDEEYGRKFGGLTETKDEKNH